MPIRTNALLILLISAFFGKKLVSFDNNSTFNWSNIVRAVFSDLCLFKIFFSSVFTFYKVKGYINGNVSFKYYASGIQLPYCSKFVINWRNKNHISFPRWRHRQKCFDVVLFLLSSLFSGRSFVSISSLVLELWQFIFITDWPEIRRSKVPPSQFFPISRDWDELRMANLAWMSVIKCY